MMKLLTTFAPLAFFLLSSFLAYTQDVGYIEGELLIQIQRNVSITNVVEDFENIDGMRTGLQAEKLISPPFDIWKLTFDPSQIDQQYLIRLMSEHPMVKIAQSNHRITMRSTLPNDPNLSSQWHHLNNGSSGVADADIDSDLAWDITTGGKTSDNDDIVIAIIEAADLSHPDLSANAWMNSGEIANNSIDDDGNGYIDDFLGWNIVSQDDNVYSGSHGTQVAGMAGAVGNNGVGVAGANWSVKLMIVARGGLDEASVIEAYTYPFIMRRLYNQSNGVSGAFVVATNASWGIDGGDPSSAPLWCAMYDSLGKEGILSCGATANNNVDVDAVGDLPTACPSDFMVSVTATNSSDDRTFSAYGQTTIDVGAPGSSVYTTSIGGGYGSTSGTSFASPLTAGVIGLLYSIPCPGFMTLVKSDPKAGASAVKSALLSGVDQVGNLPGTILTGGRVNAFSSANILLNAYGCGGIQICTTPGGLSVTGVTQTAATLSWSGSINANSYQIQHRAVGIPNWTTVNQSSTNLALNGLTECTSYEFQVQAICDSGSSNYSSLFTFNTAGCGNCVDLAFCSSTSSDTEEEWISNVTLNTINNTSGGSPGYADFTTISTSLMIGDSYTFSATPAYMATTFSEYFIAWIDFNQDGDFDDISELVFDAGGLTTSTVSGIVTIPTTALTGSSRMRVSMKWNGAPTPCETFSFGEVEDYCVNIVDDGINCEQVLNLSTSNVSPFSATLQWDAVSSADHYSIRGRKTGTTNFISLLILNGATNSKNVSGLNQGTSYEWEIIAYCDPNETLASPWSGLTTFTTSTCNEPFSPATTNITATTARLTWSTVPNATAYNIRGRRAGTSAFTSLSINNGSTTFKDVQGLSSGTAYEWQIRTRCGNGYSPFTSFVNFSTLSTKVSNGSYAPIDRIFLFPNPANESVRVQCEAELKNISIIDITGTTLLEHSDLDQQFDLQIATTNLANGVYHIFIETANSYQVKKLVIAR